jgi:hypothetical protein
MSAVSRPRKSGPPGGSHSRRLWCDECQTDERLIIESIDTLRPPRTGLVEVTYTCVGCGFFYTHAASLEGAGEVLNRPDQPSGLLQFGRHYLHCGTPMTLAAYHQRSIQARLSTQPAGEGPLEVQFRTRALRCSCGFQIEIPD